MVVRHLADPLRPERLPAQVLAPVPAAGRARHSLLAFLRPSPFLPRVVVESGLAQGQKLGDQLLAARRGEARRDPDVVQRPLVVVEPEKKRTDHRAGAVLVPAEAADDAVGGARVLDLDHLALAGKVLAGKALGDDAVEARALEA